MSESSVHERMRVCVCVTRRCVRVCMCVCVMYTYVVYPRCTRRSSLHENAVHSFVRPLARSLARARVYSRGGIHTRA